MTVVPVLVVGAGPTGVTAATLLARHGVRTLVAEAHPGVYPLPRAVHLDDEVLRILQRLGVAEEFAALSRPSGGLRLVDRELRTIAEFRRDPGAGWHGWPQANMFDQPDLERLLRANLLRRPEAELRLGTEVVEIEQDVPGGPAPVRALLRPAATGRCEEVWAHAVLGCDGANGVTRGLLGARMLDLGFAERWLVVDARCAVPLDVWDGVHQVCDLERPATFMRVGRDRYRWEFLIRPGESEDDLTAAGTLGALLARWTRGVPDGELHLLRKASYTFRAQVADRWRDGRVFLLGDAAHLTPPFIGQGMGAGLRDAANLAWKLALVLSEGGDELLLDTYEAERAPHVTRMIRLAVTIGRAMSGSVVNGRAMKGGAVHGLPADGLPGGESGDGHSRSPLWAPTMAPTMAGGSSPSRAATGAAAGGVVPLRLLLALAGRLPGIDPVAKGGSPRLRRGPLVRSRAMPPWRRLAGTVAPQPWVTVDGERCRLDDVLGESFAVISLGPVAPSLAALARRLRAPILRPHPVPTLRTDRVPLLGRRPASTPRTGCDGRSDAGVTDGGLAGPSPADEPLAATPDGWLGERIVVDDGTLARWLLRAGAAAVLLRPDRVVLAAAPPPRRAGTTGAAIARDAASWLPLLPPTRTARAPAGHPERVRRERLPSE
ncbi:bifunctional 3-(3-hydroxy-phenyl)propionate/3-hydroxycinnamic acid hydroxylase [Nonomuraea muscovyensis]|uniref:bifunctional 3-(3-hydroxy-phenyl)propionate/3-hydroxycinnamic acid hydroxylase n=1 Tax=Nonomuraea muscovyensis TaxID=1124761 RepID=UPI00340F94D8